VATYEKSWQFDINRVYSDAVTSADMTKYTLWYLKAFLTGQIGGATLGLWTVVGSSDSVTGGMDGVDRWGSTFDATKLVRASANTAHSWCVLKSPLIKGSFYYFNIEWKSGADYSFYPQFTTSLPTGGSNTTPPVSATPTAAPGTTTATPISASTNPGAMHLHAALATDGSFYLLTSRDNVGKFLAGVVCVWLGNAKPTDSYPLFLHCNGDIGQSNGYGASGVSNGMEWNNGGCMLAPDNSLAGLWAGVIPSTTNLPAGSDPFDSSYLDFPVFVGASAIAYRGLRGRVQDIMFFPGGASTGTVDNTAGAPTYMVVGSYWFPTNAAPIL
jgi:hypothetical protein